MLSDNDLKIFVKKELIKCFKAVDDDLISYVFGKQLTIKAE